MFFSVSNPVTHIEVGGIRVFLEWGNRKGDFGLQTNVLIQEILFPASLVYKEFFSWLEKFQAKKKYRHCKIDLLKK